LLEHVDIEAGYDTEVVGAAFQSTEKVRVRGCIGVDGLPGGEDDLEVVDIVACEAVAAGEER
jgi:hypothetical protein